MDSRKVMPSVIFTARIGLRLCAGLTHLRLHAIYTLSGERNASPALHCKPAPRGHGAILTVD